MLSVDCFWHDMMSTVEVGHPSPVVTETTLAFPIAGYGDYTNILDLAALHGIEVIESAFRDGLMVMHFQSLNDTVKMRLVYEGETSPTH